MAKKWQKNGTQNSRKSIVLISIFVGNVQLWVKSLYFLLFPYYKKNQIIEVQKEDIKKIEVGKIELTWLWLN